jgi:hypothetical protein
MNISRDDQIALGALLASRAASKERDAKAAESKGRHPSLITSLRQEAEWSRQMAVTMLDDYDDLPDA